MSAPEERAATDPEKSVVVVACAGSGKTRLLVGRIVRLLKSGAKPGEILAVTFTRKAAAEIRGRVLESLRAERPDIRRRILLAESPEDSLAVYTFDGWFLFLAGRCPWSASRRDPPRVGDDNNTPLLNEAWRNWLNVESDSDAARELARFITPDAIEKLLLQFAKNVSLPWRLHQRLCQSDSSSKSEEQDEKIAHDKLRESAQKFARLAEGKGKIFQTAQLAAQKFASGDCDGEALRAAFLNAKYERRAKLTATDDSLTDDLTAALLEWMEREQTARAAVFNRAAMTAGAAFMRELDSVKARRHITGFNDIAFSVWEALARPGAGEAEALRYRLDCKYRHILIDEFQDTSPAQWQVVRAWLADAHGSDESPSVFIVGDTRQAIYYWRGGDPRLLDSAAQFLREYYNAVPVRQNICYRCAPQILDAVNATFEGADNFIPHESPEDEWKIRGRVEWKVFEKESARAELPPMRDPLARSPGEAQDPMRARWAEHIAETTADVLKNWRIEGKPVREEDILILLRQFTHAGILLEKMAARGIRCATGGAFLDTFECADVLALASFLASPSRDIKLARTLKSPIFSLTDDALRDIALHTEAGRGKLSLWEKLRARADISPESARAVECLTKWRTLAEKEHLPAHDLLSRIYREGEIVSRYLASVPEALCGRVSANLRELLDLALMMDGGRRPLLAQFLSGCERDEAEDKTQGVGGGVSILTTHKAKGLEAAVVIVGDANFSEIESGGRGDSVEILIDWPPESPAPDSFVVRPRSLPLAWPDLVEKDARAKLQENNNILYVAMTRAKRALFLFAPGENKHGPAVRFNLFEKLAALPGAEGDASGGRAGDSYAAQTGEKDAAADAEEGVVSADSIPSGRELVRTEEQIDGEILHHLIALGLSGFSQDEMRRLLPAGTANLEALMEKANRVLSSSDLRELLDGAEIEVEANYADSRGIFRPDLVVRKDGETWVVDYKSGKTSPEDHKSQLRRYARALEAQRAAILTAEGELRELAV